MSDGEDWLMEPVGVMCQYESLIDGTLGIHDIARMNEALLVRNENQVRYDEAMRDKNR